MKNFASIIILTLFINTSYAQETWKADPMHSQVTFSVTHMGISEVTGVFNTYDVTANSTKADFSDALFELSADVTSIDTRVEMRDTHLKSPDWFDAALFPKLVFKSKSIKKVSADKYKISGDLTMHGITKPVIMDLWYRGTTQNPMSKAPTAGFQLTGSLNRTDFGVGTLTGSGAMVSNQVLIKADGEFASQPVIKQ